MAGSRLVSALGSHADYAIPASIGLTTLNVDAAEGLLSILVGALTAAHLLLRLEKAVRDRIKRWRDAKKCKCS